MADEQTEVQDNTNTSTENVSTESTTTIESEATNTNVSEQTEKSTEQSTDSVDENEQKLGAPEQYEEFNVPENFTAPIDDFKTWAKENNMTQEAAQSTVDFYVNKIVPQMQAEQEAQVTKWAEESTTKFGKEGIEAAKNALGRFSTPEFKEFLDKTGLGNHPEMIGIFKEINSKISESNLIEGSQAISKPKTLGQIFYGNTMNK